MTTEALKVLDHNEVFRKSEYTDSWTGKKAFEGPASAEKVAEITDYIKTEEYKEKNFAREAVTINPAKACQPLGALLAASGFDGCLPYVHGSQGCAAYFRSHFNRHFKEPFAAVSDSMTEDAAVFGGHKNMDAGLQNAYALYKPKMIAVCTSCMAEVIGDDLFSFINNAKKAEMIPADLPVPYAHTPSFVGSHTTGYDNMMAGVLKGLTSEVEKTESDNGTINIIPGFDGFTVGNIPEMKRMMSLMGIEATILGDNSDILNTPMDGEYKMYDGGTTVEATEAAKNAKATFSLLPDCTEKATKEIVKLKWEQELVEMTPLGIAGTDAFLMKMSELTGKPIPEELEIERGRALDAMADSNYYLHGKRFGIYGDPSYVEGLVEFMMEMGAEPVHVVITNATKKVGKKLRKKWADKPFAASMEVYTGKDLWHMRSLLATDPVDFLIGSTHGKSMAKELEIPLIRIGFPIFDRHHLHRYPTFGYKGLINILQWTVNTILDDLDNKAMSFNLDYVR